MLKPKKLLLLLGGMAATLLLAVFAGMSLARADPDSPWLLPSSVSFQKQSELSSPPPSINGNTDCFEKANQVCSVGTAYGSADTSGSVQLNDSDSSYPVVSYIDGREHFIAVPGSNTFITYSSGPPYGIYTYFNYNFLSSANKADEGLGGYYQVNRPPDGTLEDKAGHRLPSDYTSMSFSENGDWMVVSEPGVAMLRVNLRTFDVLPFAPGFDYSIGKDPAPQTAISNDGRYAVVASKDFHRFNIYDLDTCGEVPAVITGPVTCQSRDLQSDMSNGVPGYVGTTNIRFISDGTLGLYVNYLSGTQTKTAKYIASSGNGAVHQQDYLALGDSYISGEGAYDYLPGTDTVDSQCHVSRESYPLLLGAELNYDSYHSVACSGATTDDVINAGGEYSGQVSPHTEKQKISDSAISSILSNFQPGYIDQLDFVKQYQPKVITISIGGNDIGFSARLRSCLGTGTCYGTYEDRLEFVREVNHAFPKLVDTYAKLKSAGAADTRIYVIGYPQIALAGGDCAANVHMNKDELEFAAQAIDYLDATISQAAAKAGVFYVDTQDAFYGHRLCEAGPGSVAMNGITAGNDFPDRLNGPIGRESYHPNAFGHQLLENRILEATRNLTAEMPTADLSAAPPAEAGLEILNVPHSGRAVNATEYEPNLLDDLAYQGSPVDINIDGSEHGLAPGTTLGAELHSSPVSLGSFMIDANGNLNAQITIPQTVASGYHTVHFYGTNLNGQPVDIYKEVYVAATADDLDGNGIADSAQACVGVPAAGLDSDQDGIDDSCDGDIGQAPSANPADNQIEVSLDNASILSSAELDEPGSDNTTDYSPASRAKNNLSAGKVLGAETGLAAAAANPQNLRLPASYIAFPSLGIFTVVSLAAAARKLF